MGFRHSLPFFYETNIDARVVPVCLDGEAAKYEVSSPNDNMLKGLRLKTRIR
jgi:isopenicillin N synthase-like dioxygenase